MTIDIVTPTRKLVEGAETNSVKLPSVKGEAEILPGHTAMMALLGTGILSFVHDGRERKFAVSYGFAEVREDKVIVLAETVEESKEINKERAHKAQTKAQEALSAVLTEDDFKKYQLKLQRAIVRQQIS